MSVELMAPGWWVSDARHARSHCRGASGPESPRDLPDGNSHQATGPPPDYRDDATGSATTSRGDPVGVHVIIAAAVRCRPVQREESWDVGDGRRENVVCFGRSDASLASPRRILDGVTR